MRNFYNTSEATTHVPSPWLEMSAVRMRTFRYIADQMSHVCQPHHDMDVGPKKNIRLSPYPSKDIAGITPASITTLKVHAISSCTDDKS